VKSRKPCDLSQYVNSQHRGLIWMSELCMRSVDNSGNCVQIWTRISSANRTQFGGKRAGERKKLNFQGDPKWNIWVENEFK